jgi:hypothetical protein
MAQIDGIHAASAGPASMSRGWRIVLIVAAALEFLGGLQGIPLLLGDLSEIPGPGLGGWIITTKIVLQPVLGLLALLLAVTGRVPGALLAMALIILLTWLNFLPSVAIHGLDLGGNVFVALHMLFQIVLAPLLAVVVAALAIRGRRLALATILAVVPTLVGVLSVVAFAIGIAIYGF